MEEARQGSFVSILSGFFIFREKGLFAFDMAGHVDSEDAIDCFLIPPHPKVLRVTQSFCNLAATLLQRVIRNPGHTMETEHIHCVDMSHLI